MNRERLIQLMANQYNTQPEYPWASDPESAVFRHHSNRKWFALVMNLEKGRLGLKGEGRLDVMNLKCDPLLMGSLLQDPGIFPGYHMNKSTWISVVLDDTIEDEKIEWLLDISYQLTEPKPKKKPGSS